MVALRRFRKTNPSFAEVVPYAGGLKPILGTSRVGVSASTPSLGEGRAGGLYDATLTLFAAIIDGRSRMATARSSPSLTALRAHPEASGVADDAYRRARADRPHGRRRRHGPPQRPYSARGGGRACDCANSSTVRRSTRALNLGSTFVWPHRRGDEFHGSPTPHPRSYRTKGSQVRALRTGPGCDLQPDR